ncbi:unnamed protein product [Lota lota]
MAKAWCLDCVEALCQDCVAAHKRVKVTRCHRILNQRPEDFPKSDSAARAIFCSIHPKEVIQLYCFTCDLLTCRDCQLMDHRTHDFQFVCMAYQSIRKQMYRVLKPVDKHTETAMQSIQVMSSRLKDIHSNKAKLKLSFETLVKTFCLQFKQRLSQHYAQVVAIYKSEEEILRNTMQGLLEKVEEYTIRMRTIEDDTTDIKTLLARKAEMKRWSKWILSQEVSPPKSMTKATITINTTSWKAILSLAEEVMARNPLLYQIILKCLSSSGYTGNAGTSGPEHTQPIPASKDAPPSPQGPLPTTEIVKGLADSACDVSSNQGSEKGSQAPNIQENKLISTVSDTKLLQDIPSIVSERLTVWEDGGELSDTKDVKPPTYSGVQEAAPASPACPEPHLEAGCTQAAGALAEDPASPESPEEDLVDPEPLGEEPSEDDPAEVGGLASTEGPCNYSPVVSLFRLPLLSVAPGRPLPRIFIHAGDTDQEMYLEEKIEDDVSAASSMSEGLQLSAVLGVDADGSLLDPVSKGADQQPASAPGGDPGPGQDADQEEKAGPRRRRPKKRSKVAEKMKETRKRLRAFLETSSSLPTKKRAAHQGTMYMV